MQCGGRIPVSNEGRPDGMCVRHVEAEPIGFTPIYTQCHFNEVSCGMMQTIDA